jgi:tetratricopeptide (TPR) repeat protein
MPTNVPTALTHAQHLLTLQPALAEQQAAAILDAVPGHPQALLILGAARRRQGDPQGARKVLAPLAVAQPKAARVHVELGLSLAALGEAQDAAVSLRHAVTVQPAMPDAWRALGDVLILLGEDAGADAAYARHIETSVHDPRLMHAALALGRQDINEAQRLLRAHLDENATDVAAMRMLAEALTRSGRNKEAEALLARCLELAPSFTGARHNYAVVLYRQHRAADAIPHLERLHQDDPADPAYRNLLAACLAMIGDSARAIALYEGVMAHYRDQPRIWLSFGHALRTAGRPDDSIAAYRRSLQLSPDLGEAWWSLANLKTAPFTPEDVEAMQGQLRSARLDAEARFHLHYALGRALEDSGDYEQSFRHYAEGARLRRAEIRYDADRTEDQVSRAIALYTPAFFAARAGAGCADAAPIFIVGLPRAGSTLIEQILASHADVEGTMELPELPSLVRDIGERDAYPESVARLGGDDLATLGERYVARACIYRKLNRRRFIDKLPNNFLHIGLIHLILPNATIIDARRHPMATCFSAFKQHFARGQHFSYDLTELGRYYADYARLMAHFESALPGRVHRVDHETLVDDTETEVRRLLAACGLEFDAACLRFHENTRPVRTASSEQVRRPIFREGLEHWRNYTPWLGELRDALGRD